MKSAILAAALLLSLSACQKSDQGPQGQDPAARVAGAPEPPYADAAFGKRVRAYLLAHPEVLAEVSQKLQEKQQSQAAASARIAILKHRAALERDPRDFVANPNGRYTIVQFSDYRCSFCKLAAPEVLKMIEENPDTRFVFKEFPIFGEVSDTAARVAVTDLGKKNGLALYRDLMSEKALNEAALDRHLQAVGIDPAAARRAARGADVDKHIADNRALAHALNIEGTPAFLIGDVMVPGADMDAVRVALAQLKAQNIKPIAPVALDKPAGA